MVEHQYRANRQFHVYLFRGSPFPGGPGHTIQFFGTAAQGRATADNTTKATYPGKLTC